MATTGTAPSAEYTEFRNLSGKSVIITGGTTGIGRATARRLLLAGANVLIFGREEAAVQEALADMEGLGSGKVHGLSADVSKHEDVVRVFAEADSRFGGLDILINNAAQGAHSIEEMPYEEFHSVLSTNLIGYMDCAREAVNRMKAKGEGHIVNIGSMSAWTREENADVYVATKAGIEGFSESLRKQVNKKGIKVTLIEPGLVGTDMTVDQVPVEGQPAKIEAGEMLKAEDLAETVYFTLIQPQRCDLVFVQIRPHNQAI